MSAQFFKRSLFTRVIAFVIIVNFVLTSVPVSYASIVCSDSLRITPATRGNSLQEGIKGDLAKRTNPEKIDPLVLSNIISLLEGAQTGGTNIEHGILIDGANGGIFNHSEPRERLEIVMQSMLDNTAPEIEEQKEKKFYYEKEDRDRALKRLEETWINTLKKIAGLSEKEINEKLDEWLRTPFNSFDKNRLPSARRLVNYIMNVQLKKVIVYSDKYPMAQNVLCVGETKSQYEAKKTQDILREDLVQILAGITKEQAQKIGLRIAYEPRWAIGTGLTPKNEEIQVTHRFIKDTVNQILGVELDVDYGGSLNEKNSAEILALKDVDGGLIGGAAKDPKKIAVVIDEAIKQGEIKGKLLNIGMNWKAENESTGLSPLDAFVELFRTKDLSKVHIAIGTPNVKLVRETMTTLENEISAVALYSGIVVKTENIGTFTKETLAAKSQNTEAIYAELEKRFGEKTREGDTYFRLKTGDRYFALAKENTKDQTLMTAATLDLTDPKAKAEYYDVLLRYVFLVTTSSGKRIQLIEEKGDRLRTYLYSYYTPEGGFGEETVSPEELHVRLGNDIDGERPWGPVMKYKPKGTDPQVKPILLNFSEEFYRPFARGWSLFAKTEETAEAPAVMSGAGPTASQLANLTDLPASLTEDKLTPGLAVTQKPAQAQELYTAVPWLVNRKSELKDKRVVSRVDWNVPSLNSVIRIRASIPGILHVIKNGGTVVVATHYGRPGGKVNPKYSVKPLADILKRLLVEQGEVNIAVNFLEGSVTEQGLQEGTKEKIIPGAVNVLENTRFCPGDEKNDPAFAKALAGLGDIFNFAGFGAGERAHASTVGLAEYMDGITLDPLTVKEEVEIRGLLENLYGLIFGGGPKVSEKITTIKSILVNIKEGGYVIIGTGPLPAFLKAMYNIEIGQKAAEADVAAAKEIIALAEKKKVRIILPTYYVASDKSLVDGKLPDDANILNVTLEELKRGPSFLPFIYDIRSQSISEFKQVMRDTPKDNTICWNGPVGVNEIPAFETGTKEMAITLGEISKNDTRSEGSNGVVLGADTAAAMEQFGVDQQLTFVSTGGGASLALLEGKELTAIEKLAEIQATRNAVAEKFNIGVNDYIGYVNSDVTIHNAQGGRAFGTFTDDALKYLQALSSEALKNMKAQAIIVDPNFFRAGGVKSAINTVAKLSRFVRIALYGENAENIRTLIGNKDIIIAKDINTLYSELSRIDIGNTIVLRSQDELPESVQLALKKAGDAQIVSSQLATLAVARAIKELLNVKEIDGVFEKFLNQMRTDNVISEQAYNDNRATLLAKLEKGKVFEFSPDLKPAPAVTEKTEVAAARKKYEEFLTKIGV